MKDKAKVLKILPIAIDKDPKGNLFPSLQTIFESHKDNQLVTSTLTKLKNQSS